MVIELDPDKKYGVEKKPGLVTFRKEVDKASQDPRQREFIEALEKSYEALGKIAEKQKEDLTRKRYSEKTLVAAGVKGPESLSPYLMILPDESGEIKPFLLPDAPGYTELCDNLVQEVHWAVDCLPKTNFRNKRWLEEILQIQVAPFDHGFQRGDFREATLTRLRYTRDSKNPHPNPWIYPFWGEGDRYYDPANIKFCVTGEARVIDPNMTGMLADKLRKAEILSEGRVRRGADLRVTAGNALWLSGVIGEMMFSGETWPSEDDIRALYTDIDINLNCFGLKFEKYLAPLLQEYLPEEVNFKGWRQKAHLGGLIMLIMHEHGHKLANMNQNSVVDLGRLYTPTKELQSEVLGQLDVINLAGVRDISVRTARLALSNSLAWARFDQEEYDRLPTRPRKVYADAASPMIGYYDEVGAIDYNLDNGKIKIGDLDYFGKVIERYAHALEFAVEREGFNPGLVKKVTTFNNKPGNGFRVAGAGS